VSSDIAAAVPRPVFLRVLIELRAELEQRAHLYAHDRVHGRVGCFWHRRHYFDGTRLHRFEFAVKDSDPALLEVIWVLHTA
jgi:hypothetical protein